LLRGDRSAKAAANQESTIVRVERLLTDSAIRAPAATAVVSGKMRLSYGDLDRMSDRLAAAMTAGGVVQGDRVVAFMDNSWEAVVAIFAVLKAGAVLSPVDPAAKSEGLALGLNRVRAPAILTQARLAGVAGSAIANAPSVKLAVLAGGDGSPAGQGCLRFEDAIRTARPSAPAGAAGSEADPALLFDPAGRTMTHEEVAVAATSVVLHLETRPEDVIVAALPISDGLGLGQILAGVQVGATLLMDPGFAFPQAIVRAMDEARVIGLAIPSVVADGIAGSQMLQPGRFPHPRYIASGIATAPPAHLARLQELFPAARIVATDNLKQHQGQTASAGWARPGASMRAGAGGLGGLVAGQMAHRPAVHAGSAS
jgi:long-chain acyl-CoA synthetase